MGIKFHCDSCDRKLNVKSFLAGKRGICPHCGAKIRIPEASQTSVAVDSSAVESSGVESSGIESSASGSQLSEPLAGAAKAESTEHPEAEVVVDFSSVVIAQQDQPTPDEGPPAAANQASHVANDMVVDNKNAVEVSESTSGSGHDAGTPGSPSHDPIADAPDAKWYVRPPSGGQYGPAEGDIMRKWIEEGRVSADSLVWREGWVDWRPAGPEFLGLSEDTAVPPEHFSGDVPAPDVPQVADQPQTVNAAPARIPKKTNGVGIAIVVILGLMVFLLSIMLLVIVMRQDGSPDGDSTWLEPRQRMSRCETSAGVPIRFAQMSAAQLSAQLPMWIPAAQRRDGNRFKKETNFAGLVFASFES